MWYTTDSFRINIRKKKILPANQLKPGDIFYKEEPEITLDFDNGNQKLFFASGTIQEVRPNGSIADTQKVSEEELQLIIEYIDKKYMNKKQDRQVE